MKRFFLVAILLFPILTLVFWVYRGDSIRPRKMPDLNAGPQGQNLPPADSSGTNIPSAPNSSRQTKMTNLDETAPAN
ncbi:MAG TPA: hypothetical protein VFC07_01650 [Verrucomicrobiae bacterium]|nr:hypothetical protein [Verrucomicrobiae bacterium]